MAQRHGAEKGQSESKAYETRDVKVRPLAVFVAGLTIVGVFVYLVVFVMFRLFSGQAANVDASLRRRRSRGPSPPPGGERLPPEPRIQANPAADMGALRRQEDAVLTTYGWVDRQAGIVRIPIDVAIAQVPRRRATRSSARQRSSAGGYAGATGDGFRTCVRRP